MDLKAAAKHCVCDMSHRVRGSDFKSYGFQYLSTVLRRCAAVDEICDMSHRVRGSDFNSIRFQYGFQEVCGEAAGDDRIDV